MANGKCEFHPDRDAVAVVCGEGLCEACKANVTCPRCRSVQLGRYLNPETNTVECHCGAVWPLIETV